MGTQTKRTPGRNHSRCSPDLIIHRDEVSLTAHDACGTMEPEVTRALRTNALA